MQNRITARIKAKKLATYITGYSSKYKHTLLNFQISTRTRGLSGCRISIVVGVHTFGNFTYLRRTEAHLWIVADTVGN
jgi:hypothetical protein